MAERFRLKYNRLLEIIGDVAECAAGNLVLVGGTALALFYLKHRLSIDLDFVPVSGDETKAGQVLKGCLTKKGYRTMRGAFQNQFILQFEDTSIKIEVFKPEVNIKKTKLFEVGNAKLAVASLSDLLKLKELAYAERREARDLFDIAFILKDAGKDLSQVHKLVAKYGAPLNVEELKEMVPSEEDHSFFRKVLDDAA